MNEMKRYVNTVERCLRLDPATRLRVMNDLASDLQSRLEAGRWSRSGRNWGRTSPRRSRR